jgi:hypothetical protein
MAQVKFIKTIGTVLSQQSNSDSIQITSIGVGTSAPTNGITNTGQVTQNVTIITGNYSVTASDYFIGIGTISGSLTITLPASPNIGRMLIIKDTTGLLSILNILTINGNGKNVDNVASLTFTLATTKITLIFNGTQWNSI